MTTLPTRDDPIYQIWHSMKKRCFNPTDSSYESYGKRGITVCVRWMTYKNFAEDMGPRPPNTTMDRKENDGDYEPGNCHWASREQQANNTSRNRHIEFRGERLTASQWTKKLGVNRWVLYGRIKSGWSDEEIISTPFRSETSITAPAA